MHLEDYFEFLSEDDIRIQGHRLGIDAVLEPFLEGFSPEAIAQDDPELGLEKIYAAITYYFHRQAAMDGYLGQLNERREHSHQQMLKNPSAIAERIRALKANSSLPSAS
jgi:uncharacterized protein (DUF433 family)